MKQEIIEVAGSFDLSKEIEVRDHAKQVFDLIDTAETTRKDYKYRIGLFLDFIFEQGFNINTFLEYKRFLKEKQNYSVATKNKYLTTARIFLKELNRQGKLPADITQNIKSFSNGKKHKRDGISDIEMNKIINYIKELPEGLAGIRIKALITLLALQGLREIEITRIKVNDIDFPGKKLFIQGKGRDDKEPVYLQPETLKALQEYKQAWKVADGYLFISTSNNKKAGITTQTIRDIVKPILKALEINKTIHGFRHYFTTRLIKTYKGNLLEVAQYTRHKSIEMLQVYNDSVIKEADLPRFYNAFKGLNFV